MPHHTSLLHPVCRAFPLVGLALWLAACNPEPVVGPEGPQGPPGETGDPGATGGQGEPGFDTLVATSPVERGSDDCTYGGTRYDVGLDDGAGGGVARDGTLQPGEVTSTHFVCNPAGGVYPGFQEPTGLAGQYTLVARGGVATASDSYGGEGGDVILLVGGPTGGHLGVFSRGRAVATFAVPDPAPVELGPRPLVVASGTLTIASIGAGTEGTISLGGYFQYNNVQDWSNDDNIYQRTSNGYERVTGIRVQAGATLRFTNDSGWYDSQTARVVLQGDLVNEGTITTVFSGSAVPDKPGLMIAARNIYLRTGSSINLRGQDAPSSRPGRGGNLSLVATARRNLQPYDTTWSCSSGEGVPSGSLINQGTIDLSGGSTTSGVYYGGEGGSERSSYLCGADRVVNTGTILGRGGDATGAYYGGGAGAYRVALESPAGEVFNSGVIDLRGGNGSVRGGQGGRIRLRGFETRNTAVLIADGGTSACSGENYCYGGEAGEIEVAASGASVSTTGDLYARGGDQTGAAFYGGYGGRGGRLSVYSGEGYQEGVEQVFPGGHVEVSGDIDISGGDATHWAGYGGEAQMGVIAYPFLPGMADGQSFSLLGYTGVDLAGGVGVTGGQGGQLILHQFTFSGFNGPVEVAIDAAEAPSGAIVLDVPVHGRGGASTGSQRGGDGGAVWLANDELFGSQNSVIHVRAPIDVRGGDGLYGGRGGPVLIDGPTDVYLGAAILAGGGAGTSDGGGGYFERYLNGPFQSRYASGLEARARGGMLAVSGDLSVAGGAGGTYGGEGAATVLRGQTVDVSGDVDASGANAPLTSGTYAGWGGSITVHSYGTFSALTGALTADAGTGTNLGRDGQIVVDGLIEQWGWQSDYY